FPGVAEARNAALDSGMRSVLAAYSPRGGSSVFDLSGPLAQGCFGPINIATMRQEDLTRMLECRKDFKRKLFAEAIRKLEVDPTLADVPACATVAEASSGLCHMTGGQLDQVH